MSVEAGETGSVREASAKSEAATALRIRRLELDLGDLRAENDRLKRSAARHQQEVDRYAARLAGLEGRLERVYRVARWTGLHRLTGRRA